MKELYKSELKKINGGGLFGGFAGGVIGFVGGVVLAAVTSVVDPDATEGTFAKQIYTATLSGAAIGTVLGGPL
jgi:hypothetical protein